MSAYRNTTCRYCHSDKLKKFLSLGWHPPSNSFIRSDRIVMEERYPLEVYLCEKCYLVQLLDVVAPELIFDEYLYLSSSSQALRNHYARLADSLTSRFNLGPGDVVVDIGCNDGVLLLGYHLPGLIKVGVEPSKVAERAIASGLEVVKAFFSVEVSRHIVGAHGLAKIITATNVFAHVDKIGQFVEGVLALLKYDDGVFIIEAPYLVDMVDQTLFDTIYHEHLCYLSMTPLIPFLAKYGLEVFDVEKVPIGASGPAFRAFVRKRVDWRQVNDSVYRMLTAEAAWGIGRVERYLEFASKVESIKAEVLGIIEKLRGSGARIGGYGAPAKGNTLLNYMGITPTMLECIADTNPLKQGLVTPGSHIPIVSEEEFLRRMPEYALLLSWNYLDFFLENSEYIKRGGRFIVSLPLPAIISGKGGARLKNTPAKNLPA